MVQNKIVLKKFLCALVLVNFCITVPLSALPLDLAFNFLNKADEAYRQGDVDNAYEYINQAFVISNENIGENNDLHDSIVYFAQTIYKDKLKILFKDFDETEFHSIETNLSTYPKLKNSEINKLVAQIKLKLSDPDSQGLLKEYENNLFDYREDLSNVADSQNDFSINEDNGFEEMKNKYTQMGIIPKKTKQNTFFSIVSLVIIFILIVIFIVIVCIKGAAHQHLQEKQYIKIFKVNPSTNKNSKKKSAFSSADIIKSITDIQNGNDEITKEDSEELLKLVKQCQNLGDKIDAATGRKNNSKNVSEIVYKLSVELELPPITSMINFCAAMIYDAGFLGIDQDLLNSVSFNEEEKEAMKTHVSLTKKYLKFVPKKYISIFEDAATKHHENMDGSGYPRGLEGGEIPQIARIIRVAESFVSISSRRLYRAAVDKKTAVLKLKEKPQFYDQDVVLALEKII